VIRESNVESAALFAEWKIIRAVDGEGEHAWIALENAGGAVTLMNIQVDDGDTVDFL
jgi:hypothetical protein